MNSFNRIQMTKLLGFGCLLITLLFVSSCSKCQGDLDPGIDKTDKAAKKANENELVVISDRSLLHSLSPAIMDFKRNNPSLNVIVKAAHPDQIVSMSKEADVVLVPGYEVLTQLSDNMFVSEQPAKYVFRKLKLLASKDNSLVLDNPFHLLQPALDIIAIAPPNTVLGNLSREMLDIWKIRDKVKHKLHLVKDQRTSRKLVGEGKVKLAFVFDVPQSNAVLYKEILSDVMPSKRYLHYYFVTVTKGAKAKQVDNFIQYISRPAVFKHLEKFGFYNEMDFHPDNVDQQIKNIEKRLDSDEGKANKSGRNADEIKKEVKTSKPLKKKSK